MSHHPAPAHDWKKKCWFFIQRGSQPVFSGVFTVYVCEVPVAYRTALCIIKGVIHSTNIY